jgi:hypothetical protein
VSLRCDAVTCSVEEQSNLRLHTDEQLRGACGAPTSLAGEPSVRHTWKREPRTTSLKNDRHPLPLATTQGLTFRKFLLA